MSIALRPVDELLWTMPYIVKAAPNAWARGFALSILGSAKRPGWRPSPKQHSVMNRLVAQHYATRGLATGDDGSDVDLIES